MWQFSWRKCGQIFDPTKHALPLNCEQFAQSPQVLIFDQFVRIYFSTRSVSEGKYLSQVAFVDMTKDFRQILKVSDDVVIPLGDLGCFDEHGIFPVNILRHGDLIYAYTSGWSRRVSVSVETGIGLAISRDQGRSFVRFGDGPVLGASMHEPCLVVDGFVRHVRGQFHMWYIFGTGWRRSAIDATPERTYKIGHATSNDGISWVRNEAQQIIANRLGVDECQALPCVIEIDNIYHMFFCFRESFDFRRNDARGYRIGHAWSEDLNIWHRDDDNPLLDVTPNSWDSDMVCYPHVFELDGEIYMIYNGNEFGRYGFGLAVLKR
jgi:hypothetical protein